MHFILDFGNTVQQASMDPLSSQAVLTEFGYIKRAAEQHELRKLSPLVHSNFMCVL
jgi:hypothetical protein